MMIFVAWIANASAACPENAHARALHAAGRVEYAFANVDEPAFATAAADLRGAMPCIQTALSPLDAAGIHRAMAMVTFVEGDESAAREAWAAFRSLQPAWQPTDALIPPGHDLRTAFDEAAKLETTVTPVSYEPPGGWIVDGTDASNVPDGRPYLLQAVGADGQIVATLYQWETRLPDAGRLGFEETKAAWGGPMLRVVAGAAVVPNKDTQNPEAGWGDVWTATDVGGVGIGGLLSVRWTPIAAVAVDVQGIVGSKTSSRASAHVAGGPRLGTLAVRARVGVAMSTMTERAASDVSHRMGGPSLGLELELPLEFISVFAVAEHSFARSLPYETHGRAAVDVPLGGPLVASASLGAWSRRAEVVGDGETLAVLRSDAAIVTAGVGARW